MSIKTDKIICPTCHAKGTWTPENKFRPFCSDRCKLIDLGEWADEGHKIPGDPVQLDDPDDENLDS